MKKNILMYSAIALMALNGIAIAKESSYCAGHFTNKDTSTLCLLERLWKASTVKDRDDIEALIDAKAEKVIKDKKFTSADAKKLRDNLSVFYLDVFNVAARINTTLSKSQLADKFTGFAQKMASENKDLNAFKSFLVATDFGYTKLK